MCICTCMYPWKIGFQIHFPQDTLICKCTYRDGRGIGVFDAFWQQLICACMCASAVSVNWAKSTLKMLTILWTSGFISHLVSTWTLHELPYDHDQRLKEREAVAMHIQDIHEATSTMRKQRQRTCLCCTAHWYTYWLYGGWSLHTSWLCQSSQSCMLYMC